MAYRLPSNLHRNRHGTLYLRLAVPGDLRPIVGKAEIYRSLHTASVRLAANSAQTLKIALQRLFDELRVLREKQLSDGYQATPEALLRDVVSQLEQEERQRQQVALAKILHDRKTQALQGERDEELEQQAAKHAAELARRDAEHQRQMQALQAQARATAIAAHGLGHRQAAATLSRAAPPIVAAPAPAGPLLSEVIHAFISEKKARDKWEPKTEEAKRLGFRLFSQFMKERLGHDPRACEIDRAACVAYLELLKKLPPNITKNHQGRPLMEVAKLGLEPQSSRSINKYVGYVSGLFAWAKEIQNYEIRGNPAFQLSVLEKSVKKRRSFKDEEITALLNHQSFKTRNFLHSYHYWLIPMALHTGARLGELCQLRTADFVTVDGISCISITDEEEEQTLKNKNAKRLVPIHYFLINLGLVRHVEKLKAAKQARVFPEINLTHGSSHEASKWFNDNGRFSDNCGVTDSDTDFHSFRYTFITRTTDQNGGGAHVSNVAPIVGHETGLITGDIYRTVSTAERQITVEKFQLPPEIADLIPPVEQVTFGKRPPRKTRGETA